MSHPFSRELSGGVGYGRPRPRPGKHLAPVSEAETRAQTTHRIRRRPVPRTFATESEAALASRSVNANPRDCLVVSDTALSPRAAPIPWSIAEEFRSPLVLRTSVPINPWAALGDINPAANVSAVPESKSVAEDHWPAPAFTNPWAAWLGPQSRGVAEVPPAIQTPRRVPEDKDCIVCAESKEAASFPVSSVSRACNHVPQTCLDCLQRYIKTAVDEKAWHARVVTCPECNSAMEYHEVQIYADRATFQTYDARVLNDAIALQSDWFGCPGAGCGSGQIHEASDGAPIVTCVKCHGKYCFRHRVPWHQTLSCEEYDRFLADPDNFRSAFDVENERVELEREAEERLRREREAADRQLAQSLLEDEEARAEAEARARREEAARAEAEQREAEERAARKRAEAAARAQAAEDAKRRAREINASEALVKRTTKNCPGCGWPIEKNAGW